MLNSRCNQKVADKVLPTVKELSEMKIYLTSVYVDDQDKALKFYTEVLGFLKKSAFPVGLFKWLTVVSPEEPDGVELLLEPNDNPAARQYQKALFEQGIAATSFAVSDIQKEYERMKRLGVVFTMEPTPMGPAIIAVFDDTCGNLIQIAQKS
jgi:predicted enzyme related to lactoylglutathione lyase